MIHNLKQVEAKGIPSTIRMKMPSTTMKPDQPPPVTYSNPFPNPENSYRRPIIIKTPLNPQSSPQSNQLHSNTNNRRLPLWRVYLFWLCSGWTFEVTQSQFRQKRCGRLWAKLRSVMMSTVRIPQSMNFNAWQLRCSIRKQPSSHPQVRQS